MLEWHYAGPDFGHDLEPAGAFRHAPFRETVVGNLLFACWSQLVFDTDEGLVVRGYRNGQPNIPSGSVQSLFGDHNGYAGLIDYKGRLCLTDTTPDDLHMPLEVYRPSRHIAKAISDVVAAGNDRVVVVFGHDGHGKTHVQDFVNLHHLRAFYDSDLEGDVDIYPVSFSLGAKVTQLVANTGVFVCYTGDGRVITWGDSRYRGLGRALGEGEDDFDLPLDLFGHRSYRRPGFVDSLGGIRITKVAAGGWAWAAVSSDKDIYICCPTVPGPGARLAQALNTDNQPGELTLININAADGNPLDLVDVAIGEAFVLVRSSTGQVFGIGNNSAGQLGVGIAAEFVDTWTEVAPGGVCAIAAGPDCSLLGL